MSSPVVLSVTEAQRDYLLAALRGKWLKGSRPDQAGYALQKRGLVAEVAGWGDTPGKLTKPGKHLAECLKALLG